MQSGLGVHHQHQQVGFFDRLQYLPLDLDVHRDARVVGQTTCVDQPELATIPFGAREMPVARSASLLADDGAILANDAVEQSRLADVGTSDERNDRQIHVSTTPASDSSTSMKSYDGKIGIARDSRTASSV